MKRLTWLFIALSLSFLTLSVTAGWADTTPWHDGLCLGNQGQWRSRLAIEVRNDMSRDAKGEPARVVVGSGHREADLVGARIESLRVCDHQGVEVLYNVVSPTGDDLRSGALAEGSQLVLPAECAEGTTVRYWAYFDNDVAWGVPDWLPTGAGIRNGGFEVGEGLAPAGWQNDATDAQHHLAWVDEQPRSGRRCMQTVVDAGASATWIATRQGSLPIIGGARYVMRAWVKAQDVAGYAGWYVHVGNGKNAMLISPMLPGGDGSYGWKEVKTEFTAPADADRADLGTVLRGTGTAWFDDVSLECLDPPKLSAHAGPRESLRIAVRGADEPWPKRKSSDAPDWDYRFPVSVINHSDVATDRTLICVDLASALARLRGRVDRASLCVIANDRVLKSYQVKDLLLIEGEAIPPHTMQVYYLYLAATDPNKTAATEEANSKGQLSPTDKSQYDELLSSPYNLAANPSFEEGDSQPSKWSGGAPSEHPAVVEMDRVSPGLFGERCAHLGVPQDATPSWVGWRQDIAVAPRKSYLYAAWLKCADLKGGLQLHAHYRNAVGEYCSTLQTGGAGPAMEGTEDWAIRSGLFTMPDDIANFQLHLTMNATGSAWHDGAILVEVQAGQVGPLQPRVAVATSGFQVWPVNSIVKVFREDQPPSQSGALRISMARSEYEPLQLAVRTDRDVSEVRVEVDPPKNAAGATVGDVQVGVVGYVPIDYPTNYYNTKSAAWVRKVPATAPACDGWAGYWPDPLLPRDTFTLSAHQTQPVWITCKTASDTAPGDYQGVVRFVSKGKAIANLPFTVHVWNFALPKENHVRAIYDLRMNGQWDIPGKSSEESRRDFLRFMAEHRVCPDTIDPAPDLRYENGQVIADFTAFDRAAEFALDELGMTHFYTPWSFYLFGWGFPPAEKFGQKPYEGSYPYADVDRLTLRPEYKQAYQAVLKVYWDHLKERGWDQKCVLYICDEPFHTQPAIIAQMKALCDMIHEVDPKIFIYCSTWAHVPEWDGYINCWGIGHYGVVAPEVIAERKAAGDRIRWTTDGQMCTDTPYCAVERLLPTYCFKYGAEAYEFWGINWLTFDPYRWGWHRYIAQSDTPENSYFVRYPNGDGFLAYPGAPVGHSGPVPSIRLEQAREGCEDYEYLYLLREMIDKAKAAGRDTATAEDALAQSQQLVSIPNAGGRNSTQVLRDPDRVFVNRARVAEAIEAMSDK